MLRFFIAVVLYGFIQSPANAQADAAGHIDCPTPVLEYTTGNEERDGYLYSPGVEWVIVDVVKDLDDPGWNVQIHLVAEGDDELESFELHPEGLAQVLTSNGWKLQRDFEESLCRLSTVEDLAFRF